MNRHNFKKLQFWHLSMDVVDDIYSLTRYFPKEEIFGLTHQLRKSAISIPSNISEGCGRGTDLQLLQFTDIAQGSAYELETQVYITQRRKYCPDNEVEAVLSKISSVQKMIDGFQDNFR